MQVSHWLILGSAGIILLAGQSFGGDLRWKAHEGSPVLCIPAVISTDEQGQPAVLQVQHTVPIQPPRRVLPTPAQLDLQYPERRPQSLTPPAGATLESPPIPPRNIPLRAGNESATACGEKIVLKSIKEIEYDIRPKNAAELPEECVLDGEPYHGRHFDRSCMQWKASGVCTKAAYFEDVQLERHGHTVCPVLQPVISGAKFFATVPLLPYKMGVTPPGECVYTLGHYRVGSCAPHMIEPLPISARGALFEAGAVTGAIIAVP
jgi:hypothetical protein